MDLNEFDCLVVRRGDSGHFAEKFVKKILFLAKVITVTMSRFGCRY